MSIPSFVSVVDRCDNFRLEYTSENFAEFRLSFDSKHVVGLISDGVLDALKDANITSLSAFQPPVWDIRDKSQADRNNTAMVTFREWVDTPAKRTQALKTLTERWRDSGLFSNIISPRLWRDELYPVYSDAFGPRTEDRIALVIERTACALFGLVTYGVHMTMYTADWKIWVPTRAKTKPTWPLFLDNTVAGGIPYGMSPFEALVKECSEEANLEESFVKAHAKSCGAVSYFYRTANGYLQPEVQFVYDLLIPRGQEGNYTPKPFDGEVESFKLEDLETVVEKMHKDLFKPNCALVLVDFMIRHGKITPESEPNYLDLTTRLVVSLMSNQQQPPLKREDQSGQSFQREMISRMYATLEMELKAQFAATNAQIAVMDKRLGFLEGALQSVASKVDRLDGKVDRLEGKVDRLETNVAAILGILQSREGDRV